MFKQALYAYLRVSKCYGSIINRSISPIDAS